MTDTLLLQSCSARKVETGNQLPALERYDGYFFRIIKKAIRDGAFDTSLDLRILSAKYGILSPDDHIEYYDQKISTDRAIDLRGDTISELRQLIQTKGYEKVVINMASEYRHVIRGFDEGFDIIVHEVNGTGIGEKGHKLKHLIRTDETASAEP